MTGNGMTYPHPREPKRANTIAYFIVGAVVVLLAIGAFFFAREVREESETPAAGTGQPVTENPVAPLVRNRVTSTPRNCGRKNRPTRNTGRV